MPSAIKAALATPAIFDAILDHLYTFRLDEQALGYLRSASLVSRCWTRPSQARLHRILRFDRGSYQINKWIEAVEPYETPEGLSRFETIGIHLDCQRPFDEGQGDYDLIEEMLHRVNGVNSVIVALMGQRAIPSEWFVAQNLAANLEQLYLCSPLAASDATTSFERLSTVGFIDRFPDMARDWSATCKFLSMCANRGQASIEILEMPDLPNYTRYLAPDLPLPKDPALIRGNLLPLAETLRTLALPGLVPGEHLANLAIFGVACRQLKTLKFSAITTLSASSIEILRFFSTIKTLEFLELTGLPNGPFLHAHQLERYAAAGRGDPIRALTELVAMKEVPNLNTIVLGKHKFFYQEHRQNLIRVIEAKGGGQIHLTQEIEPTLEEHREVETLHHELMALNVLNVAKQHAEWARSQNSINLEILTPAEFQARHNGEIA